MQPFAVYELLFFVLPVVAYFVAIRMVRPLLVSFKYFQLTIPMLLLPLWVVVIEGFGWRLYELSFFPWWCYVMLPVLWLHYFDYIRKVAVFEWQAYFRVATKLLFTTSSFLLFGMGILRILTYFLI